MYFFQPVSILLLAILSFEVEIIKSYEIHLIKIKNMLIRLTPRKRQINSNAFRKLGLIKREKSVFLTYEIAHIKTIDNNKGLAYHC
jgi:hypothetical protein